MPSKFSHYNGRIERETKEYGTSLTSTATTAIIFVRFSIVVGYVILCNINYCFERTGVLSPDPTPATITTTINKIGFNFDRNAVFAATEIKKKKRE